MKLEDTRLRDWNLCMAGGEEKTGKTLKLEDTRLRDWNRNYYWGYLPCNAVEIRRYSITRLKLLRRDRTHGICSSVEIRRYSITRLKLKRRQATIHQIYVEIRRYSITRLKRQVPFPDARHAPSLKLEDTRLRDWNPDPSKLEPTPLWVEIRRYSITRLKRSTPYRFGTLRWSLKLEDSRLRDWN